MDLTDRFAVSEIVRLTQPDVVQHLAAQSSVAASWRDPIASLTENAAMQLNVLAAIQDSSPLARVVVVGSCDEYGNVRPEDNPIDETHELRPANPYALSKVTQDLMGRQYAEVAGLSVIRVRPFLQLGPRRPDRFVAGSFARQIAEIQLRLREPVVEVGNIDLQRDFIDVRDVARAFALAGEQGLAGEVYNIASGTSHTLRELLGVMMRVAFVEADIREDPARKREAEAPIMVGNAERLKGATGWSPEISFEQSAADTFHYWQKQLSQSLVQGEANV